MDSISQIALGAAVSIAVFRQKQPLWRSALFGAALGTLPDLDVLISYNDPISEMTYHRTESHSLFYLTLLSPLLAWLWVNLFKQQSSFKQSLLAAWLTLITHPILDMGTVYGTQFLLPFSDTPLGTGSVFVIDPLYTMLLLLGAGMTLSGRSIRWNNIGLMLSSMYLVFGLWSQNQAETVALAQLPENVSKNEKPRLLVTATPGNTLLWRLVFIGKHEYFESYYSIFDPKKTIVWKRYNSGHGLLEQWKNNDYVQRLYWFTGGFLSLKLESNKLLITDLRMGMDPYYAFQFSLPIQDGAAGLPRQENYDVPSGASIWLYKRATGQTQKVFSEYQALRENASTNN